MILHGRLIQPSKERRKTLRLAKGGQRSESYLLDVGMRVVQGQGKDGPTRLVAQQAQIPCASGTKQKVQAWEKMQQPVRVCECLAQRNWRDLA